MADFNINQILFQGTSGAIFNGIAITLIGLLFVAVLGGLFYLWKFKTRYDIKVRVYSKRYGTWKTWDEEGAILKNKKTGEAYGFKLKHEKDLIEPPPFQILLPSLKGSNVLHIMQLSSGEWFYLVPELDDLTNDPEKMKKFKLKIIEGDIQLWTCNMLDKIYSLYKKDSVWDKIIPIMIWAIPMVFIMITIYLVLQKFEILQGVASSLNEVAKNLVEVAKLLNEAKATGAMVPSGV